MQKNDSTFLCDVEDFDLFKIYENRQEIQKLHFEYLEYLDRIRIKLSNKYPLEYETLNREAHFFYANEIRNGSIIEGKDNVPVNMYEMTEDQLWGYMFMPAVFLRYKTFGPWTKDLVFLKSLCEQKDIFLFVADRFGEMQCPIANNIGMLSNGDIISCCLDYEGEMNYGNIDYINLWDNELLKHLEETRNNVLTHKLCRRCKGDIIIADKTPIIGDEQEITFFASDWFPYEKDAYEKGGRWSRYSSTAYVYVRLETNKLYIKLFSVENHQPIGIKIYSYDNKYDRFIEECIDTFILHGGEEKISIFFNFKIGVFYKIEVHINTFQPCVKYYGSEDNRNLGIFVFDMKLVK